MIDLTSAYEVRDALDNKVIDSIIDEFGNIWYEAWKKLIASGVPPITLQKCKGVDDGKYLLDYKIYGNSVQGKLPSDYRQVEYIQSTGTQIIDTGIKANLETKIIFDYQFPQFSNTVGSGRLFGCRTNENSFAFICGASNGLAQEAGNLFIQFDNVVPTTIIKPLIDTNRHVIELSKNGAYYDSELWRTINNPTEFTTRENIVLFGMWNIADTTTPSSGGMYRLYSCKFYENEVLVRDFIPCYRISDNVIGLYDLVSSKFYTNTGTGTFLKGSNAPTLNAPIEIESVGEKTRNLFDKNNANVIGAYINISQNQVGYPANDSKLIVIPCKPNTTYTVSYDYNSITSSIFRTAYVTVEDITSQTWTDIYNYDYTANKDHTITTGENAISIVIQVGNSAYSTIKETLQIEEGSTATEYEPYGYRIPIKVRGKNLFDNVWENGFINTSTGNNQSLSTFIRSVNYNEVASGAKYYISSPNVGGKDEGVTVYVYFYDKNKTYLGRTVTYTDRSINTLKNTKYIRLSVLTLDLNAKIQIEEGNIATEYEPYYEPITTNIYLNEPLRKIGDYADYIDFEKGKVVREVLENTLTGSINWSTSGTRFYYSNNSLNLKCLGTDVIGVMSSHLKGATWNSIRNSGTGIATYTNNRIDIRADGVWATTDEVKAYLSENPISYIAPMLNPEEETIELPNIPTNKGTTIIEVNTSILPSNMEVKYIGKE